MESNELSSSSVSFEFLVSGPLYIINITENLKNLLFMWVKFIDLYIFYIKNLNREVMKIFINL